MDCSNIKNPWFSSRGSIVSCWFGIIVVVVFRTWTLFRAMSLASKIITGGDEELKFVVSNCVSTTKIELVTAMFIFMASSLCTTIHVLASIVMSNGRRIAR